LIMDTIENGEQVDLVLGVVCHAKTLRMWLLING
jgi:hypothetical protein